MPAPLQDQLYLKLLTERKSDRRHIPRIRFTQALGIVIIPLASGLPSTLIWGATLIAALLSPTSHPTDTHGVTSGSLSGLDQPLLTLESTHSTATSRCPTTPSSSPSFPRPAVPCFLIFETQEMFVTLEVRLRSEKIGHVMLHHSDIVCIYSDKKDTPVGFAQAARAALPA